MSVAIGGQRRLVDNASDTVRGISLAAFAYLIWTLGDGATKWAIPAAGVAATMAWRGVLGSITIGAAVTARRGWTGWCRLVPQRWGMVLLRAALGAFTSCSWYFAWRSMSLADSYAIGFTAPLIMTLLAIPLLGERIRWRRALSTVIGFAGVLIMLRPGGIPVTPSAVLLFAGVITMSFTRIMTRQLSTTETAECLSLSSLLGTMICGLVLLPLFPVAGPFGTDTWLALLFLGVSNGVANWINARSYALAPVSALAPYEYTMLPWGVVVGFLMFAELPSWNTVIGAAVVCGAGLYNLWRERTRSAPIEPTPVTLRRP
jgi:drug/metabolite transporter (DMT)-like permease